MSTNIEIVIKGTDEFTPAFNALDGAFQQLEHSGVLAGTTMAGLGGAFSQLAGQVQETGQGATEFSMQMEESFQAVAREQGAALNTIAQQQETALAESSERLLQIDSEFLQRRMAETEALHAQVRAELASHLASVQAMTGNSLQSISDLENSVLGTRLTQFQGFFSALAELAATQGRSMAGFAKTLAIGEALISAYLAANRALASMPYPLNLAAAALVMAQGLANVERIRQVNIAHGGLENVPEDSTFLLRRGERVLSPGQNRDLTAFIGENRQTGQGLVVENLTIHVLENATSGDALLAMDQNILRRVVAEKLFPAMEELARLGIMPGFLEHNT